MTENEKRWKLACESELRRDRRQKRFQRRVWVALGLFLAGCAAIGGCLAHSVAVVPPVPVETASNESEAWATDAVDAGVVVAGPVPAQPLKGQKRAPCDKRREREINGACWVEIAGEVGDDQCGDYYAHGGRCYIPVKMAKRPPTSVEP